MQKSCIGLIAGLLLIAADPLRGQTFDALEYRNVGPTRGGRVTAVAGTATAPSTFFLGASGGGVWKTTDYGTTWDNVSDGYFASPSIGDISVSQTDPNLVFVGTGSDGLRSNVITGKGVYRSVDGGATWTHVGLTETGHIGAVEIDPRNNNVVWVAAIGQAFNANPERGVYRTDDGGQSWARVLSVSDTVGFADLELLPGNPEVVFAAAWKAERKPWTILSGGPAEEGGLYKTTDAGRSWRKITAGLPDGLIGKIDLAISPADTSIVYALVEAPDDEGGLYRSVDQGESFEQVSNDTGIRTRPFYYTNVEVDPTNPDIVYVMATRYFRSVDGGTTWEQVETPHVDNHDMWINPADPDLFIQSNDGGANITHNGGATWSTQFNQPTAEIYQVEVDDQYPYWLYGGQQDNGSTIAVPSRAPYRVQHPAAWLIETGGCETGPAVPKPGNHNIVYANCKGRFGVFDKRTGTERGHYVGADNMYGHNPRDLRYRFQRVAPVHVSPHDPRVVYHASQYVHRTTSEGRSWETISPDLTAFEADKQVISGSPITRDITGEEFYSTIYSLRESPLEEGLIWVGANDGPVHVTRDGGDSWQAVTPRSLPPGGRVDSVEPSHHDPAVAYIAVHRYQLGDWRPYIYRTGNYGARWQLLTDGNGIPEDHPVRVVREDPVRAGLLYAGTEYGMFVSFDDGESWLDFRQNLPVTPVTDIHVHRGDLALSTMGRSFWLLDNITTLRQAPLPETGEEPVLFRPKDTIRYRQTFRNDDPGTVPRYPPPAVIVDYYLPDARAAPVTLEFVDADGNIVNGYRSVTDAEADAEEADDSGEDRIEDMGMNETLFLDDEELTATAGLNRFRWSMRHRGAWHEEDERRFRDGPLAAPGLYTARLTVGERTYEQSFPLVTDPRVTGQGITDAVIADQVDFQLEVVALLDDARRLSQRLGEEREDSSDESARAAAIDDAQDVLVTAEGIYMEPGLIDQIEYLYNMVGDADQDPGESARERLEVLGQRFDAVRESVGGQSVAAKSRTSLR